VDEFRDLRIAQVMNDAEKRGESGKIAFAVVAVTDGAIGCIGLGTIAFFGRIRG